MERAGASEETAEAPRPSGAPISLVRQRLIRRLEAGVAYSGTLICAPPGFGKTELTRAWASATGRPGAILRLCAADGDVAVLGRHVVDALERATPGVLREASRLLDGSGVLDVAALSQALLADLAACPERVVLVLDDYDAVPGRQVHELVEGLLDAHSPGLHLVLVTAVDPPLAIPRRMASGQMHAIRQADLAFTAEETAEFLRPHTREPLTTEELGAVMDGLGGWPAGLRLLALSLGDPATRAGLVERLPPGAHEARTYLCEELYRQRREGTQRFLLACSLLGEFDVALCTAVAEPECPETTARALIEREAAILTPIAERPDWFRVQGLLREFLEDRVRLDLDLETRQRLHDRAAAWLDEVGEVSGAIDHALEGADPNSAAGILGRGRIDWLNDGRYEDLGRIASRLPQEVLNSDLETCLLQVWLTPYEAFEHAVARVESMVAASAVSEARSDAVRGELHLMRLGTLASRALELPDLSEILAHGERALALLPTHHRTARAMAHHYLAQTRQYAGDAAGADATLNEGIEAQGVAGGHPLTLLLYARAYLHFAAGENLTARNAAARASAGLQEMTYGADAARLAHAVLAAVHYEWNEVDRAAEILEELDSQSLPSSLPFLARVRLAQRRVDEANTLSAESVERGRSSAARAGLNFALAQHAQLQLRQGRDDAALRWAVAADPDTAGALLTSISCSIIRALILITAGAERDRSTAAELLASVRGIAEKAHQTRWLVQVGALEALLRSAERDEEGAQASLAAALELSAPGEFIRTYLDLGPQMRTLLARLVPPAGLEGYVARLREAFLAEPTRRTVHSPSLLADPLTDREQEILELMGQRLSNKEIGSRLFVAVATVKSHVARIHQKLHVNRRRQAVEKAIALGLLPDA